MDELRRRRRNEVRHANDDVASVFSTQTATHTVFRGMGILDLTAVELVTVVDVVVVFVSAVALAAEACDEANVRLTEDVFCPSPLCEVDGMPRDDVLADEVVVVVVTELLFDMSCD